MATANLLDAVQANPQIAATPTIPMFGEGGPYGGRQIRQSLLAAILVEMRVNNYYLHCIAAGVPVSVQDDPANIRNNELTDPAFVNYI